MSTIPEPKALTAKWIKAQEQVSACRHCIHNGPNGDACTFGGTPTTQVAARSKTGRCGPEAAMMWGRTWGPSPDGENNTCKKCGRRPFGIGCCHCHKMNLP